MPPSPEREPQYYEIPDTESTSSACDHEVVHEFGSDGANRFFECPDCGGVLIRDGVLPETETPPDDLGSFDPRLDDLLEDIDAYHAGEPTSYSAGTSKSVVARVADACRGLLR